MFSINRLRSRRMSKRSAGWVLTACYPLFLVLLTEWNQSAQFSTLVSMVTRTPLILLFDCLFLGALFWILIFLVKRVWIAALSLGILFFAFSSVEFYRYRASGAHFTLYDFAQITNLGDVAEFAEIRLYPLMFILLAVLALYLAALYFCRFQVTLSLKRRLPAGGVIVSVLMLFILSPAVSSSVFGLCGMEYGGANNNFVMSEKFDHNKMIAFLTENAIDMANNLAVKQPENYSQSAMETLSTVEVSSFQQRTEKPNVITIMSESYADFRDFEQLGISDSYYENFDRFRQEGYTGRAVVPTFGGYTVRTEFELLFGLPIKSLNATVAPQFLISDEEQATIASHYKSLGYRTVYMHAFTSELYGRGELYPRYGFDKVLFDEDFSDGSLYRQYMDDGAAFRTAVEEIRQSDDPVYLHLTTMQNHMPYDNETQSQMDYYMDGIANTDRALGELMDELKALDEPTVVLFVGDHFPFFTEEDNVYKQLNINRYNCLGLYEQNYFIWSNYGLAFDHMDHEKVSVFYLPHLVVEAAGLPQNEVNGIILEQMEADAVYTSDIKPYYNNEILDALTYDLVLGGQFSVPD